MVPSGSGVGGNADHYNSEQGAIIGLKKNEGGQWAAAIALGSKGFYDIPSQFKVGTKFSFTTDRFECVGNGYFIGTVLWAVTDKEGTIKTELKRFQINDKLSLGYGYEDTKVECNLTQAINIGDRIRMFYKATGESDWTLVKGNEGCTWEIILKEEIDIDANVSLKYERGSKRLVVKAADDIKVKLFTEDGQDISNRLGTSAQGKVINASRMNLGTYVLRLEVDEEQYREVKLKLGEPQ
jgi:hypothetical protein